jgi:hypothetical protein
MPRFFVPDTSSPEEADQVYTAFLLEARHPVARSDARLFRITFRYEDSLIVAEVGADLASWPQPLGPVVAIIETTALLYIHTRPSRGPLAMPILVSPLNVTERVYFADYPRL